MGMGFFRTKDGGKDYGFEEWSELQTGWGKSKYIGRSVKQLIGFIIFATVLLMLMTGNSW